MTTQPTPESDSAKPRRTPVVLRAWYTKMLYLIVAFGIWYFVGGLGSTQVVAGVLRAVIALVLVLLAARVFRSSAEEGNEPRSLWRMTGAPLSGFVIGVICGLIGLALGIEAFALETNSKYNAFPHQDIVNAVLALVGVILAILYITSSIRLRGIEREARIRKQRSHD